MSLSGILAGAAIYVVFLVALLLRDVRGTYRNRKDQS